MSFTKRLSVPVGIAAIVALIVAFGPSLLATAGPRLPELTAKQLLVKMQQGHVDGLSGVVEARSELGLPQLPGAQSGHHDNDIAPRDLLSGTHTLRVATAGPEKQRVEILGELAQYTFVHNGRNAWAYDSGKNRAVHWQVAEGAYDKLQKHRTHADMHGPSMTPDALARHFLDKVGPSTEVSVQGTDRVAGRAVYTLTLEPRAADSLVGKVQMFVDAETWTPLRVMVTPRGGGEAAIDVGFREVTFGEPPASRFAFTPPEGAEVKQHTIDPPVAAGRHGAPGDHRGGLRADDREHDAPQVIGQGWGSVLAFEGMAAGRSAGDAAGSDGSRFDAWLARTGEPVSGEFGSGHIITTRLLTVLATDDGRFYVGTVTPEAIKKAAATS